MRLMEPPEKPLKSDGVLLAMPEFSLCAHDWVSTFSGRDNPPLGIPAKSIFPPALSAPVNQEKPK
ncbi:MAG: hypothetical protein ABIY63_19580 [Fibrobacteria bacterium]